MILNQGAFLLLRGHLAIHGDIFGCQDWWDLLGSTGLKPGVLLNIGQCTNQASTKNYPVQKVNTSEVEKLLQSYPPLICPLPPQVIQNTIPIRSFPCLKSSSALRLKSKLSRKSWRTSWSGPFLAFCLTCHCSPTPSSPSHTSNQHRWTRPPIIPSASQSHPFIPLLTNSMSAILMGLKGNWKNKSFND